MADEKSSGRSLEERLRDDKLIQEALARGVREELRRHKQAGNPIVVWRDGQVVWIPADEIEVPDEPDAADQGDMRDEYEFSGAERGKFHRPDAALIPPVHVDPEVLAFLSAQAEARGVSLSEVVNSLLKKAIAQIKASE
jgi:hypothetical protein